MNNLTVKELPESDRPYEKCEKYGPKVLSDAELLAVIIRSGSKGERSTELACRILNMSDSKYGLSVLNHISFAELKKIRGIGRVKAIQLLCVGELSRRISLTVRRQLMSFSDSESVADYFMESMRHLEREQVRVVFLDSRNNMINEKVIYEGTIGMSPMEPREILREALKSDAVKFILLHNHPTGNPEPSSADISTTRRIEEAGRYVGIRLQDHIIIGDNRYFSFKENGVI